MALATLDVAGGERVCSLSAGVKGGVVALGFTTGTVAVKSLQVGKEGARRATDLVTTEFGAGPVFVEVDEVEAVVWAAVVDGRVFALDLEAAGEETAGFELVGKHDAEIYCACLNRERGYFITGDAKGDLAAWNNKTGLPQPRRRMCTPEREKWHCVASSGTHIVAARHNPEVFVFDLSGSPHEVRTLSGSAGNGSGNPRQIRSVFCDATAFLVGYSDGGLQRVEYAATAAHNAFTSTPVTDTLRTTVHRTADVHHPLCSIVGYPAAAPGGAVPWYYTGGGDGLYRTDLSNPRRPKVARLLSAPVACAVGTDAALLLVANGRLVELAWGALTAESP